MLSTARLQIRRIGPADHEHLLRIYGDEEGARYVDDGQPITADQCRRWIDVTLANYEARGYGMFAVESPLGVIGFVGLVHPGGQETPELKYSYAREHWGQGYATEVAEAVLAYGAEAFGMTRVIATTSPENVASHAVLRKVGMVDLGVTPDDDGDPVQTFEWCRQVH